ncbi:MAG TPA: hypothetical protein VMN79_18105 [Casimicrobiaceae bacterium]|nr:hypothetical protein [Casimicrobiaceae bacterium]
MRRTMLALLFFLPAVSGAAQGLEGRWDGHIRIPDRDAPMIVDLARDATGAWSGSIILPGLGVKGAPLANIVVTGNEVAFDLGTVLSTPGDGPARVKARLDADDRMTGELRQAGNAAAVSLTRVGAAQVDAPARSTAVAGNLVDRWTGQYELGGYPRQVSLTLENHANGAATAKLVIVGKQTTDVPVDLVVEEARLLRVQSQAYRVVFEGRLREDADELVGTIEVGAFELPLVLRRAAGRAS